MLKENSSNSQQNIHQHLICANPQNHDTLNHNINNPHYHYPFTLIPLPYDYNALEPFIDTKTMQLHHDKHLGTYIANLNATLKDYPQYHDWSLEQLLYYSYTLPDIIRQTIINNAGGVYNHNLFFASLTSDNAKATQPTGLLAKSIDLDYGNYDNFKQEFKKMALAVFGSGYTYIATCPRGKVHIVNTANQDTILPQNLCPLFLLDVWEHAYYLKHYNVRADYIDDCFNLINMQKAESLFEKVVKHC